MPLPIRRRIALVAVCLAVLVLGLAAPAPAGAEDEDTSSSVYLVFDPETGEFVTSHDPDQALPNQTGLEDSKVTAPDDAGSSADAERAETPAGSAGAVPVLMIVGAIAIAGGGFVFLRRVRSNRS